MNKKIFFALFSLSLLLGACSSNASEEELKMAATSAAQTVEARFTEMAESTPEPQATPTKIEATDIPETTPEAAPTATIVSSIAPEGCLVASLVSETIPDGTVLATGEYFTKRWYIQNNGECTWNQEYQLIYWDGDLMDGYTAYNFTDVVQPGEQIELPIELRAPDTPGVYTGYWMMKSRSGYLFGVGDNDVPISVNIDVRNTDDIDYRITSVEYYMVRDPESGCPANVKRTIYANVTVNGPMDIRYRFYQRESDGEIVKQSKEWLHFTEAGTKTVFNVWTLNKYTTQNPRYVSLVILDPDSDEPIFQYPEFMFINDCPDQSP